MGTPSRTAVRTLLLVMAGAALQACSGGEAGRPAPSTPTGGFLPSATPTAFGLGPLPRCNEPKSILAPTWIPADLPFPRGSYIYQDLGKASGYNRGLFVVPGTLTELARFVLTRWPTSGWILGRGDSEDNEIETSFTRGPALGAIKAQGVSCRPGYNVVLLVYTPDRTAVEGSPPPAQSGSPLPSPSP